MQKSSQHRHDPKVTHRLLVDAVVDQEATVRRPTAGDLDLVGGYDPLFRARAAREFLVEVTEPRPIRVEHDAGAVGRPDGAAVSRGIEREPGRARAVPAAPRLSDSVLSLVMRGRWCAQSTLPVPWVCLVRLILPARQPEREQPKRSFVHEGQRVGHEQINQEEDGRELPRGQPRQRAE